MATGDSGGPAAHASPVAREYGVPALAGVPAHGWERTYDVLHRRFDPALRRARSCR